MADPFYTLNMPSASNAHKRSYDDIAPEPDAGGSAPSGSRGESIDSPDDTSNSRERNKRPRNETTDSSYTSEVEDILLPSNTSVSSSSSGSSYHSARSAFTAASPPLLEVEEVLEDDPSDPVLHSPEPFASDSLPPTWEDTLSMMSGPIQISSPPPARPAEVPDSEEQFRRTMERVDAFDREMSALRQSPFRPSDPTDWALWNDPLLSSSGSAFSSFPRVPDPHPTVSEPPATGARAAHRALHATDRLQPTSSSMLHDDPLSNVPRVNLPRVLPRVPGLAMGSRFSQLERDAARYGDTVGRGRAREDILDRLLGEQPSRSSPLPSFSTSIDSARRAAQRRAHVTPVPLPTRRPDPPTSNSYYFPDLHAFVDDYWQRENDRQLEGFDRTIREAEEHRQRTAEFLAQAEEGPYRSSLPSRSMRDPTASVSSGYSTLRGALDDSAARRRSLSSLGSRASPTLSTSTRPTTDRFNHRRSLALFDGPVQSIGEDSGLDLLVHDDIEPAPYLRDHGLPSIRPSASREPEPPRPSMDHALPSFLYPRESSSYALTQPPRMPSYLETISRQRSSNINGLRRRVRARSPSAPSPPLIDISPLWEDVDESWNSTAGSSIDTIRRPRRRVHREPATLLDPVPPRRDPSPDPLDAFEPEPPIWGSTAGSSTNFEPSRRPRHRAPIDPVYPIPPPRYSSLDLSDAVSPALRQSSTTAAHTRSRSTRSIDLNAFREGPFRATLARSVAYSRETRQQQSQVSAERERPANAQSQNAGSAFSDSSEEDEEPWSTYLSLLRQEPRTARRDLPGISSHWRSPALRDRSVSRSIRRLDDGDDVYRSLRVRDGNAGSGSRSMASTNAQPAADRAERSSTSGTSEHGFERPVDQLRDLVSRPSATPTSDLVSRPSAAPTTSIHRTLLDRERSAFNNLRANFDNDSTAHTTGLERWEQRRQVLQRFSSRARGRDSTATTPVSSVQPPSAAATSSREGHRNEEHAFSFLDQPAEPPSRRHSRAPQLPPRYAQTGMRAGEGPTPLNGRFARRGFAPDMVWVDLPSMHRSSHFRRRWHFGDYMRDEDIDMSYEGLLTLSSLLGDVKPRGTPAEIISSLPKGTYGDWVQPGETEERCPICLDDYAASDACMRIPDCSHWFHDGCLQQWLQGARTCPVCRGRVNRAGPAESTTAPVAGPSGSSSNDRRNNRDEEDDTNRDGERTPRHWLPPWRHD